MKAYFQFVANNWALLFFCFTCVFWGNFGQSFFLGWYGGVIKESLNLSSQVYGACYSIATLASGFTMMWVGAWIDRWSLRRFVFLVATGLFISSLLLSFSFNVFTLALAFFGIRLFGQGLMPHIGNTTVARSFESNRGKAISISACGVPLGEVILPLMAVSLIGLVGWTRSWWVIAASVPFMFIPIAMALLNKAGWKDQPPKDPSSTTDLGSKSKRSAKWILFTDRRYWFAAPTLLASPFMLTAIFIHQGFLMEEKSWSVESVAAGFVVYGIVHWASSMVFGVLVDRYSGTQLLRYFNLPLIAALLIIANVPGELSVFLVLAALGTSIGATGPVVGSLWAEVYGTAVLGGIRSAAGSVSVLSTALSPFIFGVLIDRGVSLALMFNVCAAIFFAALFLLVFSFRPREV